MSGLRVATLCLLVAGLAEMTGCVVFELSKVRKTEEKRAQYARVAGTVASDAPEAEWMVVYVAKMPCDDDWSAALALVERGEVPKDPASWSPELRELGRRIRAKSSLAEHIVLQRPGFWYASLAPGCYGVGAFADLDQNYRYNDEPAAPAALSPDRLFELRAGDEREGIDLVIDPDARLQTDFDLAAQQMQQGGLRSHREQLLVSVSEVAVEGEIADLSEARFGPESAKLGYFEPYRFLWEVHPGIYFLEPYDPDRIPVLFVHGALGHPQVFSTLIEGLDRTRFQPWVFFYPSGARLEPVAEFLSRTVARLQLRHHFDELAVVAHSMGGLVSRAFILRHHEVVERDPVRLFVSISTPWGGVPSAQQGANRSPFVVPAWLDVAPDSEFLAGIFFKDPVEQTTRRRLPQQVDFHLLFGVADKTIPVPSAIRWEALRDARDRWPLPYDHTAILASPEASQLLGEILARGFH